MPWMVNRLSLWWSMDRWRMVTVPFTGGRLNVFVVWANPLDKKLTPAEAHERYGFHPYRGERLNTLSVCCRPDGSTFLLHNDKQVDVGEDVLRDSAALVRVVDDLVSAEDR